MPFGTYEELQAEIVRWLGERTDLAPQIPSFIALAEEAIAGDLRSREQHTRSIAILNEEYEYLPEDFLAVDYVSVAVDETAKRRGLHYRTMAQIDAQDYPATDPTLPCVFTIIGEQIRFAPRPAALVPPVGDADPDLQPAKFRHFEIGFWKRFDALSSPTSTNVVLLTYPSIYLFGSLIQAEPYMLNDQRLPLWHTQYQAAVERANAMDRLDTRATPAISMPECAP